MTRATLKPDPETKARLSEVKRDGETWDGLLNRAADLLEDDRETQYRPAGIPTCVGCGSAVQRWTVVDGETKCLECAGIDTSETADQEDQ